MRPGKLFRERPGYRQRRQWNKNQEKFIRTRDLQKRITQLEKCRRANPETFVFGDLTFEDENPGQEQQQQNTLRDYPSPQRAAKDFARREKQEGEEYVLGNQNKDTVNLRVGQKHSAGNVAKQSSNSSLLSQKLQKEVERAQREQRQQLVHPGFLRKFDIEMRPGQERSAEKARQPIKKQGRELIDCGDGDHAKDDR